MNWIHQICSILIFGLLHPVLSDEVNHTYNDGDDVTLWMGTTMSFYNKQETYAYYSLPFCPGPKVAISHYKTTLIEILQGVSYEFSGLNIPFKVPIPKTAYCAINLFESRIHSFKHAISNQFWYQTSLDKLSLWGVIGEINENGDDRIYYLYTHKKFNIEYNGNQIVDVDFISNMSPVKLVPNTSILFTYEVNWIETEKTFKDKFNKYLNPTYPNQIYWLNLLYSFMTVIVALSLVHIIILQTLRKRSSLSINSLTDNVKGVLINNQYDLFKPTRYPMLFSSLIGIGIQIECGSLALILNGISNEFITEQGSMLTSAIFIYVLTCPINGYYGGGLYAEMGGKLWMSQLLLSSFIGPLLVWGVTLIMSFIAMLYSVTRAMPLEATILWTLLFLFIPLFTSIGTVLAKNRVGTFTSLNTDNVQLESTTEKKWFLHPLILIPFGGIFPFGTIYIPLRSVFHSYWHYHIHSGYNFILMSFIFLIIMTLCTSVVCVHLLFKGGRYSWQWTSFLGGASIGVYVYIYSVYYFSVLTKMYGIFQTTFYFTHITLLSLAFGVMCGAVAYFGASEFVKKIYSPVNGKKRQQNILQYVLSEKSNNPVWLVPDQPLEKPAGGEHKEVQNKTDLPQLHSFGNLVLKDDVQVKISKNV